MKNIGSILVIAALGAGIVSARAVPLEGSAIARSAYPISKAHTHASNTLSDTY